MDVVFAGEPVCGFATPGANRSRISGYACARACCACAWSYVGALKEVWVRNWDRLDEKILEVQKTSRYETNEKLNSLVSKGGKSQES